MNLTHRALISITTALTLAACSTNPANFEVSTLGEQPTIDQINADNDTSINLAGTSGGLGKLVIRKIYDSNQNGKHDPGEAGIPSWGVRITSLFDDGTPSQVSDIQVTPEGAARWRGVVLNVIYGKYIVEELEPVSTKQTGPIWKMTGEKSKVVSVTPEARARAVEFGGTCLEKGSVVAFPKLKDFYDWKCRATFDLLPRINDLTATVISNGSSTLAWNVLDYSSVEIDQGVGAVTSLGFAANKVLPAKADQVFTLKATNGFGSRIATVTVKAASQGFVGEKGKWTVVGRTDRLYLSARTLPSGKIFLQGGSSRGLLDTSTGAIKVLPDSFNDGLPINGSKIVYGNTVEDLETGKTETLPFLVPTRAFVDNNTVRLSGTKVLGFTRRDPFTPGLNVPTTVDVYDLASKTTKNLDGLPGLEGNYGLYKLQNGSVAYFASELTGGNDLPPTQLVILNPETGTFTISATFTESCGPFAPGALIELSNGDILFPGGSDRTVVFFKTSCILRRSTGAIEKLPSADFQLNSSGPVFGFADGRVLKVSQNETQSEFYDVATQKFSAGQTRSVVRTDVALTQLLDGRLLALGGFKPGLPTAAPALEIELYTP